ncbi:MAG: ABC transporter ATP-binding protein [Paludibacteraceae bacterium]|nr:ABC transporter ATP-binding protein [Paludibacteraceae bacterium]
MTAIEFNHVSKQYRLGLVSTGTLSHDLNRWWQTAVLRREDPYLKIGDVNDRSTKANSEYVWALRDIDFKVEQGDVVGIIGKNGAGKSTLLKLLSKVTAPTIGSIKANGRIASLLEVGTGFHGEMTGRENIYLNGAILGMKKKEIDRKIDEIVDFSGCEKYIDTPVKRYSSGMTVRLGFAVAAHLDPEILVVDEVLAVGDAEFQRKAIGKMQDVSKGEGRTVLFVSHNMTAVKSLCKKGVILENGKIKAVGEINGIVSAYLRGDNVLENHKVWKGSIEYEKEGFRLLEIGVKKKNAHYSDLIGMDDDILVEVQYQLTKPFEQFWLGFQLKNEQGNIVFGFRATPEVIPREHNEGHYIQTCIIPGHLLNSGSYSLDLLILGGIGKHIFDIFDIISFSVEQKKRSMGEWMSREPGDLVPLLFFSEKTI